jgi:hypothetical protein
MYFFYFLLAKRAGKAPPVVLHATNFAALRFLRSANMSLDDLRENSSNRQNVSGGFAQAKQDL